MIDLITNHSADETEKEKWEQLGMPRQTVA